MKRKNLIAAIASLLILSFTMSSCLGSFALVSKVKNWNEHVGGKFVNELVFVAFWILPVYPISYVADLLVINSIEFWSGENPVTAETKIIDGKDARYKVERDATGYTVTNLNDNSRLRFNFDAQSRSWSINEGGEDIKFMQYVDDSHVRMLSRDGSFTTVELSEQGVWAYHNTLESSINFAINH